MAPALAAGFASSSMNMAIVSSSGTSSPFSMYPREMDEAELARQRLRLGPLPRANGPDEEQDEPLTVPARDALVRHRMNPS